MDDILLKILKNQELILKRQDALEKLIEDSKAEKFVSKYEFVKVTGLSNETVKRAIDNKVIPYIDVGSNQSKIPLKTASKILSGISGAIG